MIKCRNLKEEKHCTKCGSIMRHGFVVERDSPMHVWTLGQGVYWTPSEAGIIGERCALEAYACPECGYVELYLRHLSRDREIVLRASTKPPG